MSVISQPYAASHQQAGSGRRGAMKGHSSHRAAPAGVPFVPAAATDACGNHNRGKWRALATRKGGHRRRFRRADRESSLLTAAGCTHARDEHGEAAAFPRLTVM